LRWRRSGFFALPDLKRSVFGNLPAPVAWSAPTRSPPGITRPHPSPTESCWHPGPARRGGSDRSEAEAEPDAQERPSEPERPTSTPTRAPNKPSTPTRTPNKPSAEAPAESTNVRYTESTTTKSRLGWSRDQRRADYGRYGERGQFLANHGRPPLWASGAQGRAPASATLLVNLFGSPVTNKGRPTLFQRGGWMSRVAPPGFQIIGQYSHRLLLCHLTHARRYAMKVG
jgi:hypothetical protein